MPGCYTVSLTATGPGGSDTATKTHYILAAHNGADINNDGVIGLIDAILPLKIVAGMDVPFESLESIDIDVDGKIGLGETIYILNVESC